MPKEQLRTETKKRDILAALKKTRGIITEACEQVGIDRRTVHRWREEDEEFALDMAAIGEEALDFAETKLFERMEGYTFSEQKLVDGVPFDITKHWPPDTTALIFYLKTKGKKRGYIEKTEIEYSDGAIIEVFSDMDEES